MNNRWECLGGLSPIDLARRTWASVNDQEITVRAAAAAYYALTALVPFLGILVTLAANIVPDPRMPETAPGRFRDALLGQSQGLASRLLPSEAVEIVGRELERIREAPPVGLLSVGLVLSLWFSSGVFGVLIDALNRIRGVPETRPYWLVALTAVGLTLLEAVIMLGTLAVLVVWPGLSGQFGGGAVSKLLGSVWQWLPVAAGALLSFAVIARVGPAAASPWRWVTPGSVFGTAVFLAAALLLRAYVAHWGNYANTYGSLAGVMVLTTWFWIVTFVVLVAFQIDTIIKDECEKGSGT